MNYMFTIINFTHFNEHQVSYLHCILKMNGDNTVVSVIRSSTETIVLLTKDSQLIRQIIKEHLTFTKRASFYVYNKKDEFENAFMDIIESYSVS